jgi:uncharacterized protein (TIGR00730 family)
MGKIADAVLKAGGQVTGIIPQALVLKEIAHEGLTELRVVDSMHERKALMADLADGFIAMPGGFGTLDEFCEILTWAQLGIHHKPCGVLNVNGLFSALPEAARPCRKRTLSAAPSPRNGYLRQRSRNLAGTNDGV